MRNPTWKPASSKSCILVEDGNGVQMARPVSEKNVVLEHVVTCDVQKPNEHPTGYFRQQLAVLEDQEEKFPAYRGSVDPTHFQKQVSWGTWLADTLPLWQPQKQACPGSPIPLKCQLWKENEATKEGTKKQLHK